MAVPEGAHTAHYKLQVFRDDRVDMLVDFVIPLAQVRPRDAFDDAMSAALTDMADQFREQFPGASAHASRRYGLNTPEEVLGAPPLPPPGEGDPGEGDGGDGGLAPPGGFPPPTGEPIEPSPGKPPVTP
ncbi:hypothetical protein [Streptomyces bohaiensis]|uniref:hypothetical protein n=1 Tax=Streptomyces bohaiensis TaxID=1431344 RepID=UPI003B80478E